jgi:DNA-binding Lrp family transcriptional regulator
VDRLDVRILRELIQAHTVWPARPGFVAPYRAIARRIGAPAGTVRHRLSELTRRGFLRGFSIYPNPYVLGLQSGSYALVCGPTVERETLIERLAKLDGLVFFENFRGPLLGIGIAYADERDLTRKLDRIDRLAGAAGRGLFARVAHPPLRAPLRAAEWALLVRLLAGPFSSFAALASEQRTSVRTLKRRLAVLEESGAVLSFPRIDFRSIPHGVTAELLVTFVPGPERAIAERAILERLDEWLLFAGIWEDFDAYRLILPNVPTLDRLSAEVGKIPGVRSSRAELVDALVENMARFRPRVEAMLRRARAGSPAASGPRPRGASRTRRGPRPLARPPTLRLPRAP